MLRQQQQLADILVQVPPNNYVPCCRVGGSRGVMAGGGGYAAAGLVYVFVPYFLFSRHSAASFSTCDMCLRFRGCPVVLDFELSVSARYQKTRVLLRARRLLLPLLVAAAASGGVRHKI